MKNNQELEVTCYHCEHTWNYKGSNTHSATCPNCMYKVNFNRLFKLDKIYISKKDWETITNVFNLAGKNIFIQIDGVSLDWELEGYVGFNLLKSSFLTILSINQIVYYSKDKNNKLIKKKNKD